MFFKSKSNIINPQVLKIKTDKVARKVIRDAKKRIRKGELKDPRSFSMYLNYIDSRYEHIKAVVRNATMVVNYDSVRAARIAETRQLVAFHDTEFDILRSLYRNLAEKAKEAGREESLRQDIGRPPSMDALKTTLDEITKTPSLKPKITVTTPTKKGL